MSGERENQAGKLLAGRYRLRERIGRGGMGAVWLADDERLRRRVAVKLLLHQEDAHLVERFVVEARASAALSDPRIITVHDFGDENGSPFIVMELLAGHTLRRELGSHGGAGMPWRQALAIIADIARALDAAHRAGVVHRDLKPENIFLVDGRVDRIKVLDFGIARLMAPEAAREDGHVPRLTATGTFMGTPGYTAPEAALQGIVGASADLYSLGVIAFELLTGRPPFTAPTPAALVLAHATERAPMPSTLVAGIPPPVDELVALMLAKDPGQRMSAAEVVGEIEGAAHATDAGSSGPLVPAAFGIAATVALPRDSGSAITTGTAPVATPTPGTTLVLRPRVVAVLSLAALVAVIAVVSLGQLRPGTDAESIASAITRSPIVTSSTRALSPFFVTPDGAEIFYQEETAAGQQVFRQQARAGGERTPLHIDLQGGRVNDAAMTPDGALVLLVMAGILPWEGTLMVVNVATGARRQLATNVNSMVLSPYGNSIAVSDRDAVRIIGLDGAQGATVHKREANADRAAAVVGWSTGDLLLLDDESSLWAVRSDGTDHHRVFTPLRGGGAAFIKPSTLLVARGLEPGQTRRTELFLVDATATDPAPRPVATVDHSVHPRGNERYLLLDVLDVQWDLEVVPVLEAGRALGMPRQLTFDRGDDFAPQFVDNDTILFASWRLGSLDVFSQRLDGAEPTLVRGGALEQSRPIPLPGGDLLFWDVDRQLERARLVLRHAAGHEQEVVVLDVAARRAVSCSGASCVLAQAHGHTLELSSIDGRTGAMRALGSVPVDFLWSIALSPDGTTIAVGTNDDSLVLVDIGTMQLTRRQLSGLVVQHLAFLPDASALIVKAAVGSARVRYLHVPLDGGAPMSLGDRDTYVGDIDLSPNGARLVQGVWQANYAIRLVDLEGFQ